MARPVPTQQSRDDAQRCTGLVGVVGGAGQVTVQGREAVGERGRQPVPAQVPERGPRGADGVRPCRRGDRGGRHIRSTSNRPSSDRRSSRSAISRVATAASARSVPSTATASRVPDVLRDDRDGPQGAAPPAVEERVGPGEAVAGRAQVGGGPGRVARRGAIHRAAHLVGPAVEVPARPGQQADVGEGHPAQHEEHLPAASRGARAAGGRWGPAHRRAPMTTPGPRASQGEQGRGAEGADVGQVEHGRHRPEGHHGSGRRRAGGQRRPAAQVPSPTRQATSRPGRGGSSPRRAGRAPGATTPHGPGRGSAGRPPARPGGGRRRCRWGGTPRGRPPTAASAPTRARRGGSAAGPRRLVGLVCHPAPRRRGRRGRPMGRTAWHVPAGRGTAVAWRRPARTPAGAPARGPSATLVRRGRPQPEVDCGDRRVRRPSRDRQGGLGGRLPGPADRAATGWWR